MGWLVDFFHMFPHINLLTFQEVPSRFDPYEWHYLGVLFFWAVVGLALGFLFLLVIVVVWCVRCCCVGNSEHPKRLRRIQRLCYGLFIVSVFCFLWLGLSLFSNERVNRGASATADGLHDLGNDVEAVSRKISGMNHTLSTEVEPKLSELAILIREAKINGSAAKEELLAIMKNISEGLDEALGSAEAMESVVGDFAGLSDISASLSRWEFERWITCAVLLSIMLVVIFGGVLGFCRHSKIAAVLFSGLGMVLYLLAWILFAAAVGFTIGLADFCKDPRPFLAGRLSKNASREALTFYMNCSSTADSLPPPIRELDEDLTSSFAQMRASCDSLKKLVKEEVSEPEKIIAMAANISALVRGAQKAEVKIESGLTCSNALRSDYDTAMDGLCYTAMSGMGLLLLGLLLLGLFLFILLLLVSKAWHLYTRRPLDYTEVDDEDPFLPRADRSNIPADFYGTHVYNPRTRFASNADSDTGGEGSTSLWTQQQNRGAPPPAYEAVGVNGTRIRSRDII